MNLAHALIFLTFIIYPIKASRTSSKVIIPGRLVPVYADLDVSETSHLLRNVLQGVEACGDRFVWRSREELRNATAHVGPLILVATHGPNEEELSYFTDVPDTQQVVLLHLSDEFLGEIDPSIYGPGLHQVFRQYFHKGLGDRAVWYLTQANVKQLPPVAWMPLGLARLEPLPAAYSLGLLDRTHLWSWVGSTDGKPERDEMLAALEAHSRAADIKGMGFTHRFGSFGGFPGGKWSEGSMSSWEYTLLMHQTQFVPLPAGGSPEQFRLWEALEAGCLPIVLGRHLEQDAPLYPVRVLGFEVITLQEWQELPEKLLQLTEDLVAIPGVYTRKQRHNTKLWEHVKGALSAAIANSVCEAGSPAASVLRD